MSSAITVRHNFETGHRLPNLGGKCTNLHGHSWWTEVTVGSAGRHDVVVEYGEFKKALRGWIDTHLDHGVMLGGDDPLAAILPDFGKAYVFGSTLESRELNWPTVENVAVMIARAASRILLGIDHAPGAHIASVVVHETHVNAATWTVDQ